MDADSDALLTTDKGGRERKQVNYAVDVSEDDEDAMDDAGPSSTEFRDKDYKEEQKVEVQEEDGRWRKVTIYRQKRDPERVVIFFGGTEYEGLSEKYSFEEEEEEGTKVLRDGDGDEIKHRTGDKGKKKSSSASSTATTISSGSSSSSSNNVFAVQSKKRKSSPSSNLILKLQNGQDLDLTQPITEDMVSLEAMEALRQHCLTLETASKKSRSFGSLSSSSSMSTPNKTSSSSASSSITPSAKQVATSKKMVAKKLSQSIKNNLKPLKFFSGYDRVERALNVDDIVSRMEFDSVFKGVGCVTQPTKQNKPKSKVIIQKLEASELMTLLGNPTFKGQEWLKGGAPTRGFGGYGFGFGGGGGGFSKGKKLKQTEVSLSQEAVVSYSTVSNKLTLKLKFCNGAVREAFSFGDDDY